MSRSSVYPILSSLCASRILFSVYSPPTIDPRRTFLWSQVREHAVYDINRPEWAWISYPIVLASIETNLMIGFHPSYMHQRECCPCWKSLYNNLIRFDGNPKVRGILCNDYFEGPRSLPTLDAHIEYYSKVLALQAPQGSSRVFQATGHVYSPYGITTSSPLRSRLLLTYCRSNGHI